jgi:hypothetical protein
LVQNERKPHETAATAEVGSAGLTSEARLHAEQRSPQQPETRTLTSGIVEAGVVQDEPGPAPGSKFASTTAAKDDARYARSRRM